MKKGSIVFGITLIALGAALGINALGLAEIDIFFKGWWTLFIILPCFVSLFEKGDKTGDIIGIIIGVILLLTCRGILDFDRLWDYVLPLGFIALGVSLLVKSIRRRRTDEEEPAPLHDGEARGYTAIFSGQTQNYSGERFSGAGLTALFGGIELDLRNAEIAEGCVIDCRAIFGGIDIFVPDNVTIKVRPTAIFGGVDNEKNASGGVTVYINALCIFGGVDIK